jgi:hypothetical protein
VPQNIKDAAHTNDDLGARIMRCPAKEAVVPGARYIARVTSGMVFVLCRPSIDIKRILFHPLVRGI